MTPLPSPVIYAAPCRLSRKYLRFALAIVGFWDSSCRYGVALAFIFSEICLCMQLQCLKLRIIHFVQLQFWLFA